MKTIVSLGITLALITALFSCKKYPEGPALTIRSKKGRVANKWKIDKFLIGGVDSAAFYAAEGTRIEFTKDGKVTATQVETNGVQLKTTNYTGIWEFADDKKVLGWIISDDSSNDVDTSGFNILKLKEKEMWLEDEDNNPKKTTELHLTPF